MSVPDQRLSGLSREERVRLEQHFLAKRPGGAASTGSSAPAEASLSFAQESIWYVQQLRPESPVYNIPLAIALKGALNPEVLGRALSRVVERHPALRLQIVEEQTRPVQRQSAGRFELQRVDLSSQPAAEETAPAQDPNEPVPGFGFSLLSTVPPAVIRQLARCLLEEARRPFQLSRDLPIRGTLYTLGLQEHVLALTLHHIAADFASLEILCRDLEAEYGALLDGRSVPHAESGGSLAAWASRQRALAASPDLKESLEIWKRRFAGFASRLELPVDGPEPAAPTFAGSRCWKEIPAPLTRLLREMARSEGVSLYVLLLAAFRVLLFRYSEQEDLAIGSPIGQRTDPGLERVIGPLLSMVALRIDASGDPNFRELLGRTQAIVLEAFTHPDVPVELLLEHLQMNRRHAGNPLFQAVFQYLPSDWPAPALRGLSAESKPVETGTAKFDLTLTFFERGEQLAGEWEYSTERFRRETIEGMLESFQALLEDLVARPEERISRVRLLARGREEVLAQSRPAVSDYPRNRSIAELFEEQAARAPDAVALTIAEVAVTYGELNVHANQLARLLMGRGVRPGDRVAVCLERSREMVLAVLAILKAGAAYVPLDPKYPAERLDFMLRDSRAVLILVSSQTAGLLPSQTELLVIGSDLGFGRGEEGQNPGIRSGPEGAAYVMYTSGSTGVPKGVVIPQRGVVRLVKETWYAQFGPGEVFLQFAPLAFDASTFEIWGALLNGGRLVLYPPEFSSVEQFGEVVSRHQVTTLWLTAGLFHQVVEQQLHQLKSVRQLLAGGDVLSVPHVLRALRELPECQLINGYGPTENTTFTCCYPFPRDWPGGSAAPIGFPVSHTQVYVLDSSLQLVPPNVPGELCTGGDGLALEYLNSPELTNMRFVPNPFASVPGAKLYRTGDRVRMRLDGVIEFLGRMDDQVKVNGFRVQLSEIEAALRSLPQVRQAVVTVQTVPSGDKQLIAYVVSNRDGVTAAELKQALGQKLPAFEVPGQFVFLPKLPLTAQGKVDRRALTQQGTPPSAPVQVVESESLTPRQQQIANIWREVLKLGHVGLDDNFYDLGGHSLLAMRVLSRVNQAFRTRLTLDVLLAKPTVRALGEAVGAPTDDTPILARRRKSS